ncbi:MAG: sporulation initiation factor Spo0A C-terminal domain-containing protein [Clostridia bacterium]
MEEEIINFLLNCGFSPKHYGYRYLKMAIQFFIQSNLDVRCLGENLYSKLSNDENGKSKKTIEKNITCAIEWAYLRGDVEYLGKNEMFSENDRGRPTNNEFIALASNKIVYGGE